ncbi:unnamed protein product [marine sediment metagenome]|uniref:Uncharacterized protein n=1 Tax=marine sediment metagenome TaxID=412755 RepID=X1UYL0_9ZZZZ
MKNKWYIVLIVYYFILMVLPFLDINNISYQMNLVGFFPVLAMGFIIITFKCLVEDNGI